MRKIKTLISTLHSMRIAKYIILSNKPWHKKLVSRLIENRLNEEWILVEDFKDFNFEYLSQLKPDKIFIIHWSKIISEKIFSSFECVLFHMTDLPFGRGGSPLQNLIVRGYKKTKISAIKVIKEIDAGPVYLKKELKLDGSAYEIFLRSTEIMYKMIQIIIDKELVPKDQVGMITKFKRLNPNQSNIQNLKELEKIYDHIRMLDCPGYPKAFIDNEYFKFEFSKSKKIGNKIIANVQITKK